MDIYSLEKDINVHAITAKSFPSGVKAAHESLHALMTFNPNRYYLGLSWPQQDGSIVYKAAASELFSGELSRHSLEPLTIPAGNYLYIDVIDFMTRIQDIGIAFSTLLKDPRIDFDGFGVEWYKDYNVARCMIKIKSN